MTSFCKVAHKNSSLWNSIQEFPDASDWLCCTVSLFHNVLYLCTRNAYRLWTSDKKQGEKVFRRNNSSACSGYVLSIFCVWGEGRWNEEMYGTVLLSACLWCSLCYKRYFVGKMVVDISNFHYSVFPTVMECLYKEFSQRKVSEN